MIRLYILERDKQQTTNHEEPSKNRGGASPQEAIGCAFGKCHNVPFNMCEIGALNVALDHIIRPKMKTTCMWYTLKVNLCNMNALADICIYVYMYAYNLYVCEYIQCIHT